MLLFISYSHDLIAASLGPRRSFLIMSKPWLLVSPASRGIGFQLAKNLLRTTNLPIIATARGNVDDVKKNILSDTGVDSNRLGVLKLNVTGGCFPMFSESRLTGLSA